MEAVESSDPAGTGSPHHVAQGESSLPEDSVPIQQVEVTNADPTPTGDPYQQTGISVESEPSGHPAVQVKQERKGKSRAKAT